VSGQGNDRLTKAERKEQARIEREEIQRKQAARKRNRIVSLIVGVVATGIAVFIGIVLGVAVLQEHVDGRVLLGTALIVGGVALVNARLGAGRLFGRSAPAVD